MGFHEATEVYQTIGEAFRKAVEDPAISKAAAATGVILALRYSDPESLITCDFPHQKIYFGNDSGAPEPTVTLVASAQLGNRYWLGRLNLTASLAKGEIKAHGKVTALLKLVPLTKPIFAQYEAILRKAGRDDLLKEAGVA